MQSYSRNQYLESKVATASSHRLHLMLIEGAIRFGRQAEGALRRSDLSAASEPLMQSSTSSASCSPEFADKRPSSTNRLPTSICSFSVVRPKPRSMTMPTNWRKRSKLLEFERETWQMACDKIAAELLKAPNKRLRSRPGAKGNARHAASEQPVWLGRQLAILARSIVPRPMPGRPLSPSPFRLL